MSTSAGAAFRERARYEADRYGSDAWVFVRELLQNARDAGARRVWLGGMRTGGRDRVICRDDGGGMSFDHARRFLFTLYASSKRGRSRSAGRFGIGFWSVLRFAPDTILVRSRPASGEGWQVRLDGTLEWMKREGAVMDRGTEVVLERRAGGPHPEEALRRSVLRDAPFLRCRGRGERPLEVLVNGNRVAGEPEVDPPSLSFRRRGLRGVVALGPEPRVEVFAHGLRVRDAATLDELLLEGDRRPPALPATAEGLAPRLILDSRDLYVMMARGDAREDRALRRLVAVGYRELRRLVRAELDRHARLSLPARAMERLREAWSASWIPRAGAFGMVVVLAAGGSWLALRQWSGDRVMLVSSAPVLGPTAPRPARPVAYRDLEGRYRGPDVDALIGKTPAVILSYQPAGERLLFAALLVTGLREDGTTPTGDPVEALRSYQGAPCIEGCLEVELEVDADAGLLRLPVATGHRLDPASVHLDREPLSVMVTAAGEPAVLLENRRTGRLRYRSMPGVALEAVDVSSWPELPPEAEGLALALDGLPTGARALAAADFVRRRVAYDRSPATLKRHQEERDEGRDLFTRTLIVGAGDCDIQNALLAAILARSRVPTRLAVGWIGIDGATLPGLHAWVEYLDENGGWRAIDASADAGVVGGGTAAGPSQVEATSDVSPWVAGPWRIVAAAALVSLAAAAVALLLGRRAWRRSFQGGGESDLTGLLRGAALRPQVFAHVHPLFNRRVVPLLSGRAISLRQAREQQRLGRLACGRRRSELAVRAAGKGSSVLDGGRTEGVAVGEALGAVDLDRWQELLDRARAEPVALRVEEALAGGGEPARVRVAADVGEVMAVLDGSPLGLGRRSRWVVVDEASELWRVVRGHADERPALAALLLADAVVPRVGATPDVSVRCLAGLADAALCERAGGRP